MFSKRFGRSHPNIYILTNVLSDINLCNKFTFSDFIKNPMNYVNNEFKKINDDIREVIEMKDIICQNGKRNYMISISNNDLRLFLKMEREFLIENNINKEGLKILMICLRERESYQLL